jgi:hypothetical protein
MIKFWNKLKQRWGIDNDWQVLLILLAFSLAGPTTLYFHNQIDLLLGIDAESPFWIKLVVFIIVVYPLYNLSLMAFGTLLGQYRFFKNFMKGKRKLLTGKYFSRSRQGS